MWQVEPEECNCGIDYNTHQLVIKDSSTRTKLRVVFDPLRTTSVNMSLNDIMQQDLRVAVD